MGKPLGVVLLVAMSASSLLFGCSRRDELVRPGGASGGAVGGASVVAPATASGAPVAAAPAVVLSLEAAEAPGGTNPTNATNAKTEVFLVSAALDLRERVASVPAHAACTLGAVAGGGWNVWCADAFPTPVATIREGAAGLELVRPGLPGVTRPMPAGASPTLGATEASVRTLPEKACPNDAPARRAKAIASSNGSMFRNDADLKIAVVEGSRTVAWPAGVIPAATICRVLDAGEGSFTLSCAKQTTCTFRGLPGRLEITCGEARAVGLVRCGSTPYVELGEIQRARFYY